MTQKYWTSPQIYVASWLGGPVAGCYFLGRNFRKLGNPRAAKRTYLGGILGTLALCIIAMLIPQEFFDRIPKSLFPMFAVFAVGAFGERLQRKTIKEKIEQGEPRHSFWWCLLVSLSLLILQLPFFLWTLILPSYGH
jgi:hypothetical protein